MTTNNNNKWILQFRIEASKQFSLFDAYGPCLVVNSIKNHTMMLLEIGGKGKKSKIITEKPIDKIGNDDIRIDALDTDSNFA